MRLRRTLISWKHKWGSCSQKRDQCHHRQHQHPHQRRGSHQLQALLWWNVQQARWRVVRWVHGSCRWWRRRRRWRALLLWWTKGLSIYKSWTCPSRSQNICKTCWLLRVCESLSRKGYGILASVEWGRVGPCFLQVKKSDLKPYVEKQLSELGTLCSQFTTIQKDNMKVSTEQCTQVGWAHRIDKMWCRYPWNMMWGNPRQCLCFKDGLCCPEMWMLLQPTFGMCH